MNIPFWIIENFVLPVIISFFTVLATFYFNKRKEKPHLALTYNKIANNKNALYKKSKIADDLECRLKKLLNDREIYNLNHVENLLNKMLVVYRNKEYLDEKIYCDSVRNDICKVVKKLRDDVDFVRLIKKYEAYKDNSSWSFKLLNVGNSKIYNLYINVDNKNVRYRRLLDIDNLISFSLIFFDFQIRINSFDFGYDSKFEIGYSNYEKIHFYTVLKRKYNRKDEIVFSFSYIDSYNNLYEYYCCSKRLKQKVKAK